MNALRPTARLRFALACFVGATAALAQATERPAVEPDSRANAMMHLARFVRWPDESFAAADAPFVIGVYQDDDLAAVLATLVSARGEKIHRHPIICRPLDTPGDIGDCHLVFVGQSAVLPLAPLFARLQSRPILLVSDAEGFLHLGGHVQVSDRSGRPRIRLAPHNIRTANLGASSQLLRIARTD